MIFTLKVDRKTNKIGKTAAALLFWLLLWAAVSAVIEKTTAMGAELIFPGPVKVAEALWSLLFTGPFWTTVALTLLRIFLGFVLGVAVGTLLAVGTVRFRVLDTLFSPLLHMIRSTPVSSFIILMLLWLGKVRVPTVIAMLIVIPVVWAPTAEAIKETDKSLLEMARSYRFGFRRTLKLIYVPSVFPQWNAACVTALGLAWKSGVAAEVLCLPQNAVGTQLYYAKIYLETPSLFAWTAVVILLSFAVEKALKALTERGNRMNAD